MPRWFSGSFLGNTGTLIECGSANALFHPPEQSLVQLVRIDGLGNMVVHASLKANLTILIESVSRHRQDGDRLTAG